VPSARPSAVALACTHYPLLLPAIRAAAPPDVRILSQGILVADGLGDWLRRHPDMEARLSRGGRRRYVTTDDPVWFARRGEAILAPLLGAAGAALDVEKAHLAPFPSAL
jgi:glutamate racemase